MIKYTIAHGHPRGLHRRCACRARMVAADPGGGCDLPAVLRGRDREQRQARRPTPGAPPGRHRAARAAVPVRRRTERQTRHDRQFGETATTAAARRRAARRRPSWRINWRNPRIHAADRVKVWLACDDHRGQLADYLSTRGFPVVVTRRMSTRPCRHRVTRDSGMNAPDQPPACAAGAPIWRWSIVFAIACGLLSWWQWARRAETVAEIQRVDTQLRVGAGRARHPAAAAGARGTTASEWRPVTMSRALPRATSSCSRATGPSTASPGSRCSCPSSWTTAASSSSIAAGCRSARRRTPGPHPGPAGGRRHGGRPPAAGRAGAARADGAGGADSRRSTCRRSPSWPGTASTTYTGAYGLLASETPAVPPTRPAAAEKPDGRTRDRTCRTRSSGSRSASWRSSACSGRSGARSGSRRCPPSSAPPRARRSGAARGHRRRGRDPRHSAPGDRAHEDADQVRVVRVPVVFDAVGQDEHALGVQRLDGALVVRDQHDGAA